MNTQTLKPTIKMRRLSPNSMIGKVVKEHEDYVARQKNRFQAIKMACRNILEDMLPKDTRFYVDSYGITMYVPWSKENLGQARKACGSGWEYDSQYKDDSGTLTRHYHQYFSVGDAANNEYVTLSIILDPQKLVEGSCRKILVEEKEVTETYMKKVYKVICDDGSETIEVEA